MDVVRSFKCRPRQCLAKLLPLSVTKQLSSNLQLVNECHLSDGLSLLAAARDEQLLLLN